MRGLANFVTGRWTKFVVLAIWIVAVMAMSPLGAKLADETRDDTASFLPESAESTDVVEQLEDDFDAGETSQGLIVYQRDGGLTAEDKQKILDDSRKIVIEGDDEIELTEEPVVPFQPGTPPGFVSEDGSVAYTLLTLPTDFDKSSEWGENTREIIEEDTPDGLTVLLSGDLGFFTDAEEVFGELDAKLLLATVILVLVLLGAIYRAVLVALTPILVVFFAYTIANGFIYLYAQSGAVVSSNATGILIVLLFGVGTDYCLLLVSRYREELHRHEDKHDAMALALRQSGPAILASGMTVALAMLVLAIADSRNTNTLGPIAAIGVACAMVAGLTLLPALLTIFGRAGFWPRKGAVAYDPSSEFASRAGIWRRVGDKVLQAPGNALIVTVLVFGAAALGTLAYKVDYSSTSFFKASVDSVEGFKLIEDNFPAGLSAPTTVLVTSESGEVKQSDVDAAIKGLEGAEGVASATDTTQRSDDGTTASIEVILDRDPYTKDALELVPGIRDSVSDLPNGATAIVGGGAALQYDFDKAVESDLKKIVPLALLVIAIILAILLRSLVAPLVLIASVMLSFLATLGISVLIIRYIVGDPGLDASIPTFAFIFLVALGIDYTIFLMARVREEARKHGTREGMLRALAVTGPVITSAGIILAGTFSVLMTLPVTFTFDLGLMVALGILLDTFIVRTIMVPAAVELIGDKIWWPSTAQGGAQLGESYEAEADVEADAKDETPPPPPPVRQP
jgi:RND superfamily putative drug exporter